MKRSAIALAVVLTSGLVVVKAGGLEDFRDLSETTLSGRKAALVPDVGVPQRTGLSLVNKAGNAPVVCYKVAFALPSLDAGTAVTLCSGAQDLSPVACYKEAFAVPSLNASSAARLCSGAKNLSPIACYKQAFALPSLNAGTAVTLCSGAQDLSPIACYKEAFALSSLNASSAAALCVSRHARE